MGVAKAGTSSSSHSAGELYRRDLYSWTREQVSALREGRIADLDLENLAEEIQDVGSERFAKLESAYRVILLHMLEWDHQPDRRSRSWAGSIKIQRLHALRTLRDNPGLRPRRDDAMERAYETARIKASVEMKRSETTLPTHNPYSVDEVMDRPFEWPEA